MALALSSTVKAKIAAATLTAATLIGGAFTANAQQVALARPDYSACDRMSATNPKGAILCRVEVLNAHTATARRETAQLDRDAQCGRELSALKARDATVIERGRTILAGRPAAQFGVCNLLSALTRS